MVDLDWQEGRRYRVDLLVKGRPAPLVAESTAPPTPSPLIRSRYDLEEVDPHQLWETAYIGGLVCFSPDGRFLALGSEKGYLRLFDAESGRVVWAWPREGCMDASPDCLRLDATGQTLLFTNYWKGDTYNKAL
jgi:WD40 repeat protein